MTTTQYIPRPWYRWPTGLRTAILERDGYRCQLVLPVCTHLATTIDHIHPVSRGGAWFDPDNLQAACSPCNTAKRDGHPPRTPDPSRHW